MTKNTISANQSWVIAYLISWMKHLSNIKRTYSCWNRYGTEDTGWEAVMYFCFLSLFLIQPATENLWITKLATRKKLDTQNTHEKKFQTHKTPSRKNFGSTKYHEKNIWTNKISTRKNLRPTKHPGRQDGTTPLDPRDPRCYATH